jgi:hypothetical protein
MADYWNLLEESLEQAKETSIKSIFNMGDLNSIPFEV